MTQNKPVKQADSLDTNERQTILYTWNNTDTEFPKDLCIHELFEIQVLKTPNAIAIVQGDQTITYADLNKRANQVARHLRQLGVITNASVGICMERNIYMLIGVLAILKAGGAYVPLDPNYPRDRLKFMLTDSAPLALLTTKLSKNLFTELNNQIPQIILDSDNAIWHSTLDSNLDRQETGLTASDLAYIIYTSGSTGLPKGVMIIHINTVNFICWARSTFSSQVLEKTLLSTSLNFDLSVYEFFVPIAIGACVYLVQDIFELLTNPVPITLINTVPSLISSLIDTGSIPATVLTIHLAGEALKESLVSKIFSKTNVNSIWNLYGPTETFYATGVEIKRHDRFPSHIGKPIANTQIYILNTSGQPTVIGEIGEIFIGGTSVSRGYLDRPELNKERFLVNPFIADKNAKIYKTGDLGRWLPEGNIEFLGRNDHQVKIRGFRVELGEIDSKLNQYPSIKEALVIAYTEDNESDKRLIAYYLSEQVLPETDLRQHLRLSLPDYMLPTVYVQMDAWPLTPNGKLDRKALPIPKTSAAITDYYQAPQTPTEQTIADIWCKLLSINGISRHDNFFELGGHSLLAVQAVYLIKQRLGINSRLNDLFNHPVLTDFAQILSTTQHTALPPIQAQTLPKTLALSFQQQSLWFLAKIDGANTAYNISISLKLEGSLDSLAFKQALNRIIDRHEILRTTFIEIDGETIQQIAPVGQTFTLIEHDLRPALNPDSQLYFKRSRLRIFQRA